MTNNNFLQQDFARQDDADDRQFYAQPRLLVHIDAAAIAAVTDTIRRYVPPHARILDIMSSYRSHLPPEILYPEVVGLGMNALEMQANPQLTRFLVQDLNKHPTLPFDSASFDAVINTVSVQYLTQPLELFHEVARVLKPGGVSIVSFSNRCFPTKAVNIWITGSDSEHIALVQRYYELAGNFAQLIVERHVDNGISWFSQGHDPLFAVIGIRS